MNAIPPKILIVDDTAANLVAMRRLLANSGAQLFEARSGNEALALCLDHEFALILLDVNMPDMDGFEVAALLGEAEHLRDIPIIFVTAAYADDMNRLKGYRSGAVDYIAKPINDVILQSKVRVFLELYAARAKLQHALGELAERNQQLTQEIAERELMEARSSARTAITANSRWPASTSTASSTSTTAMATPLATPCCRRSPRDCRHTCAATIRWPGWAATSSRWCWRTWRIRSRHCSCAKNCARRWASLMR
jgi:CheY-like chemotaxis protein